MVIFITILFPPNLSFREVDMKVLHACRLGKATEVR